MKLDEVQEVVIGRIEAIPELADVLLLADDGRFPKIPAVENALSLDGDGLAIIVLEPEANGTVAPGSGAVAGLRVSIRVEVLENVIANQAAANIAGMKVVRLLLDGIPGEVQKGFRQAFVPGEPAFERTQSSEGLRRFAARFNVLIPVGESK